MATPPFSLPSASEVRQEAGLEISAISATLPDATSYESYITTLIGRMARVVWDSIAKKAKPYVWPLTDAIWAAAMEGETDSDIDEAQDEEEDSATDAVLYRTVAHLKRKAGYYEEAKEYDALATAIENSIAETIGFVVGRQEPQAPVSTYSSILSRADGYAVAAASGDEYSQ